MLIKCGKDLISFNGVGRIFQSEFETFLFNEGGSCCCRFSYKSKREADAAALKIRSAIKDCDAICYLPEPGFLSGQMERK